MMASAGSSWRIAIFRPGEDPIGNLAAALDAPDVIGGPDSPTDTSKAFLEVTLRRSQMGLVECIRQARIPAHENILIIADQFEELFRFKNSRQLRESHDDAIAFVKLLLDAVGQQQLPIYVVITMRSDFIGNCTEFDGLTEAINDGQYLVPRMDREERRSAITGPVAVGGAEISPRLVLRLLNDVGDDPDQLPILQHAMMRTWEYWQHESRRRRSDRPESLRGDRDDVGGAVAPRRGDVSRARDARAEADRREDVQGADRPRLGCARRAEPEAPRRALRADRRQRGRSDLGDRRLPPSRPQLPDAAGRRRAARRSR